MDCNYARQLLAFARPGADDLEADDTVALELHLATCPTCSSYARLDRAFDASLSASMRKVQFPDGMRARLQMRLVAARMMWWRCTLLRSSAVIVALLLAASVGLYYRRPVLEPANVILNAYVLTGLGRGNDETRDVVTSWLSQFDDKLQAPGEYNYKLLAFPIQSDFQGLHSVPTLVFVRGDATTMRVYVIREHAIRNVRSLTEQPLEDGGCTFAIRRYPEMSGWVFVVVTSGAPFDAFRRPEKMGVPA